MAWHLEGSFLEACPCDMVCPCITSGFTAPADVERCHMVLAFHIDAGEVEGVDVGGLTVAMIGRHAPRHGRRQLAGRDVHGRRRPEIV